LIETVQTQIGSNDLIIETGRLARQAAGAVTVRLGDTVVLAAVTASRSDRPDVDFLPLAVDYRESFYAAGRIPGGILQAGGAAQREGDPHLPAHRSSAATAVPERLAARDTGHLSPAVHGS